MHSQYGLAIINHVQLKSEDTHSSVTGKLVCETVPLLELALRI